MSEKFRRLSLSAPWRWKRGRKWKPVLAAGAAAVGAASAIDVTQKTHAIRRNFPLVVRARYWLETIGPELRQYIVTSNDEERPFSRDQRSWVYASSKLENNYFGFGTDNDVENVVGYPIVKHRTFAEFDEDTRRHTDEETGRASLGERVCQSG